MSYDKQTYNGVFIGYGIRGSIGGDTTYRMRRGNGHYDSILGHMYQDKFALVVPSSINNPESEPYRANLKAAVQHWQHALTVTEKKEYNRRAAHGLQMSGYNLFMREAMLGKVEMYVDRGDPAAFDFDVNDFIDDGTWREKDLSGIVPANAKAVLIEWEFTTVSAGREIKLRKYGNSNEINSWHAETTVGNQHQSGQAIVAIDHNKIVEYNIGNANWSELDMVVRGWWI